VGFRIFEMSLLRVWCFFAPEWKENSCV
jgi:hypothetical protein